ncbi:MAG TPA: hypothetical protein VMM59_12930 [Thermohalobaculum sp.]|nr:hypothetical protein [Thermohalobaculum sp.]
MWRATPWLTLALLLAGCEVPQTPGLSGREHELARLRGEVGFAVLESGVARVVFAANGRQIVVEPPDGYCLDEESVAVTQRSAFALVTDCVDSQGLANGESGAGLPRPFPGILTITVSGEAAFGEEPGALAAFETLLGTEAGGRLLGRGDGTGPGRVVTAERVGRALYVLVEEATAEGSESIFAPRFWRAFAEINGRLLLVTVSGFNDRPLGEDEMLAFLTAQMTRLRAANGPATGPGAAAAVLEGVETGPAAETAAERSGRASLLAPVAPPRPR